MHRTWHRVNESRMGNRNWSRSISRLGSESTLRRKQDCGKSKRAQSGKYKIESWEIRNWKCGSHSLRKWCLQMCGISNLIQNTSIGFKLVLKVELYKKVSDKMTRCNICRLGHLDLRFWNHHRHHHVFHNPRYVRLGWPIHSILPLICFEFNSSVLN